MTSTAPTHVPPMSDVSFDLDQLEEITLAASPGPWAWLPANLGTKELVSLAQVRNVDGELVDPDPDELEFIAATTCEYGLENPQPVDQAFIAASNPAVVLALIERIRNLEGRLASQAPTRTLEVH